MSLGFPVGPAALRAVAALFAPGSGMVALDLKFDRYVSYSHLRQRP
jgi:hypothetical protein